MIVLLALMILTVGTLFALELSLRLSYIYRSIEKQFKGPTLWPLLGNAPQFMYHNAESFYHVLQNFCKKNERFTRFWIGFTPYIILYKAEDVEMVLNSQVEITKSDDYQTLYEWIGKGLLTSTGSKWRQRRKIITPTFHFKILEDFLTIFNQNGTYLLEKLSSMAGKGTFNIYDLIKLYSLDNITETALGVKICAQKNSESEYTAAVKEMSSVISERLFKIWLQIDFLFNLSTYGNKHRKALKVLHDTTKSVIRQRKKIIETENSLRALGEGDSGAYGQKQRLAFLDLLLLSEGLTDSDVREEVDTFMFEGHDTVTSGISFALYNLAHNERVQEEVYKEQMEIFGDSDRDPTVRDLQEMKYLEMVIKESLRLHPSVPLFGRTIQNDLKLSNGYFLPKGSQCYINAAKLHKDPQVWPNPDEFNPDNFQPDVARKRNPYAFVPFSAGLRNCIGQKFAMMEMKSCIGKIVKKFKLKPSKNHSQNAQPTGVVILISINGVNVEIENRGTSSQVNTL